MKHWGKNRGRCGLCHAAAELRDSHYLPKSGYKKARASVLKNPNPVVLSGGEAKQSSLQVRDYKFCGDCEDRFNKRGESWILNRIQDYAAPFWLHTLLNSKTPVVSAGDLLFPQASIPQVDMEKLVYFALSIFWRGTRHWNAVDGGRPPRLYLGRQETAIRAFLLGQGKLPDEVIITIAVWPYNKVYPMALMPRVATWTDNRTYWFYFHGFIFLLARGRKIPGQQRRTCSSHSPERFLTLSATLGGKIKNDIRTKLLLSDRSSIEGMMEEIRVLRSKASGR